MDLFLSFVEVKDGFEYVFFDYIREGKLGIKDLFKWGFFRWIFRVWEGGVVIGEGLVKVLEGLDNKLYGVEEREWKMLWVFRGRW